MTKGGGTIQGDCNMHLTLASSKWTILSLMCAPAFAGAVVTNSPATITDDRLQMVLTQVPSSDTAQTRDHTVAAPATTSAHQADCQHHSNGATI